MPTKFQKWLQMVIHEIESALKAIEKNPALYNENNFAGRIEAIDHIEFNVMDRLEGLGLTTSRPEELIALQQYAARVKRQLEDIDDKLFRRLRAEIRAGVCSGTALKDLMNEYAGGDVRGGSQQAEMGYDNLDLFINSLLLIRPVPLETKEREAEMVYYQPTPARIILELVEKAHLTEEDVFYDLGSGLGQISLLVHLLTGATARGIEFEPAYCDYARGCAATLNLSRVEFINIDARQADYADGTVFFMYTPFEGRLLQEVLEKLRRESLQRTMRLFTYGPCTPQVARQSWLACIGQNGAHVDKLAIFRTL